MILAKKNIDHIRENQHRNTVENDDFYKQKQNIFNQVIRKKISTKKKKYIYISNRTTEYPKKRKKKDIKLNIKMFQKEKNNLKLDNKGVKSKNNN